MFTLHSHQLFLISINQKRIYIYILLYEIKRALLRVFQNWGGGGAGGGGEGAVKFSVKLSPTNMGFVNYSGLTFSPDFQNTEELSRSVLQK